MVTPINPCIKTEQQHYRTIQVSIFYFSFFFGQALPWPTSPANCVLVWALRVSPKHIEYLFQMDLLSPFCDCKASLAHLLLRDIGQVQTVGIFGISHHHWPTTVALQRVQNEHEEIQGGNAAALTVHASSNSSSPLKNITVRESTSASIESTRLSKQRFPHQSASAWGFVVLSRCWGPPRTQEADPWSWGSERWWASWFWRTCRHLSWSSRCASSGRRSRWWLNETRLPGSGSGGPYLLDVLPLQRGTRKLLWYHSW